MIELDSDRWHEFMHAYGQADDTPELLRQASHLPESIDWQSEPYYSLWSQLCHQGDVYTASYAAVPHIVSFCRSNLSGVSQTLPQLAVCIEISRLTGRGPEIPVDIKEAYFEALAGLPKLIASMHAEKPSEGLTLIGSASFAINFGDGVLAKAFLEMSSDIAPEFLEWVFER